MVANTEEKPREIPLHHLKPLPTHTFTHFYTHKSHSYKHWLCPQMHICRHSLHTLCAVCATAGMCFNSIIINSAGSHCCSFSLIFTRLPCSPTLSLFLSLEIPQLTQFTATVGLSWGTFLVFLSTPLLCRFLFCKFGLYLFCSLHIHVIFQGPLWFLPFNAMIYSLICKWFVSLILVKYFSCCEHKNKDI